MLTDLYSNTERLKSRLLVLSPIILIIDEHCWQFLFEHTISSECFVICTQLLLTTMSEISNRSGKLIYYLALPDFITVIPLLSLDSRTTHLYWLVSCKWTREVIWKVMMTFGLVVSWTPASNKITMQQWNMKKEKISKTSRWRRWRRKIK